MFAHVLVHFVDGDKGKGNEYEFASAFDATQASPVQKCAECRHTFDDCLRNPTCGLWTTLGDAVTDLFEIGPRLSSSGRASAAITGVHARGDFVVVHQAALARRETAFLDLTSEPFIVID